MGGELMRAAAKMAGAAVTGAVRRGASMVPQLEQLIPGTPRPASVAVASSFSLQPAKACVVAEVEAVQKPTPEEFAAFEDELAVEASGPEPRFVFGSVPSFEEAREATTELNEALDKMFLSSPVSSGTKLNASSYTEPTPDRSVPKYVLQAFRLLRESVPAQTVVASLASDQKIWDAVMENEEVKSFMQSHQTNKEFESQKLPEELDDGTDATDPRNSGISFSNALRRIKSSINSVAGTVAGMVASASSQSHPTNAIHVGDKEFESQKLPKELDDATDATDPRNSGNIFSNALRRIKSSINSVAGTVPGMVANAGTVPGMVANASSFFPKIFKSSAAEDSGDDKASSGFPPPEKDMVRSIMGLVILVVMIVVFKRM